MCGVKVKIITDDEFNHLRSQIVISNDNLNLKSQFAISSLSGMRREPYTFAEPHIGCVQNNSPEFEGIRNQAGLNSFVLSEKPIEKQAAAQFVQIPWGQNITQNLPDEFRSSLPSIEEIEAELSGVEESQ